VPIDPNIKFTRARTGYDPQEVDAAFDQMHAEIMDLTQQKNVLANTVSQYGAKLQQMNENARQLESARNKENSRLTNTLNAASRVADEMKLEAQREAENIVAEARQNAGQIYLAAKQEADKVTRQAQSDLVTSRHVLNQLYQTALLMEKSHREQSSITNARLDEWVQVIEKSLKILPNMPQPGGAPPQQGQPAPQQPQGPRQGPQTQPVPPIPPQAAASQPPPVQNAPPPPPPQQAPGKDNDPYIAFIREMGLAKEG